MDQAAARAVRTPGTGPNHRALPHCAERRLPARLYALAEAEKRDHPGGVEDLYAQVANRLAELVRNVRTVAVDQDDQRQLLSVVMTDLNDTEHVAGALSDGILRFLALAVMEFDTEGPPLLGLEEIENGVHPDGIPALLDLLEDFAVDVEEPVDPDNPLRQVIVTTHSPMFVAAVDESCLLVAHTGSGNSLSIHPLHGTWRDGKDAAEDTGRPRSCPRVSELPRGSRPRGRNAKREGGARPGPGRSPALTAVPGFPDRTATVPHRATLLTDGTSDAALTPILKWLLQQLTAEEFEVTWADPRRLREPPRKLDARISAALGQYPCTLPFVHRDAEKQEPGRRYEEIGNANLTGHPLVSVVPVRMRETSFLHDENAIRTAAGRRSGTEPLALPPPRRWEALPDPKEVLHEALRRAHAAKGRRAKKS